MAEIIKYKNIFGEYISENQVPTLKEYYKCYIEDDEIQKEEEHREGQLIGYIHYRQSGETIGYILDNFFIEGKFLTIREKTPVGDYIYQSDTVYKASNVMDMKENTLYDSHLNTIAYEQITVFAPDEVPSYGLTKKYYYDPAVDPENFLFECFYNEDGSLDHIYIDNEALQMDDQDSEAFVDEEESLERLKEITGISSTLLTYYLSPNVYPDFVV